LDNDRIDWHLWNWTRWQHTGALVVGYASRASGGFRSGSLHEFDAMVVEADNECAIAVDVILAGLSPAQRCAVHHVHLDAVYRFVDAVLLATAYSAARFAIGRGLDVRGVA
jgi:hypothetical protein